MKIQTYRKTLLSTLAIFLFLIFSNFTACASTAESKAGETEVILSTAESTFNAMKLGNYAELWRTLSRKSQESIIRNVAKEMKKNGFSADKGKIARDFAEGGELSRDYWNSYLTAFNPEEVLEHSRWDMGPVGKKEAEILLQHRKAQNPAHLKLFRENGVWRVGLEETFSGRRIMSAAPGGFSAP